MTVTTSPDPSARRTASPPVTAGSGRDSWRESAACRHADTELFFPIGRVGNAAAETRQAKAICARCPVRQPCLTYALATNQAYGIWGGCDDEERRVLRRQQRDSPPPAQTPCQSQDPPRPG